MWILLPTDTSYSVIEQKLIIFVCSENPKLCVYFRCEVVQCLVQLLLPEEQPQQLRFIYGGPHYANLQLQLELWLAKILFQSLEYNLENHLLFLQKMLSAK